LDRPVWRYYFQVPSAAAAGPKIASAGGAVVNGPHQVPNGQWILQGADPQGALFAVVSDNP
jgi:predicted enzyme related to lactoylglutathione lyase